MKSITAKDGHKICQKEPITHSNLSRFVYRFQVASMSGRYELKALTAIDRMWLSYAHKTINNEVKVS